MVHVEQSTVIVGELFGRFEDLVMHVLPLAFATEDFEIIPLSQIGVIVQMNCGQYRQCAEYYHGFELVHPGHGMSLHTKFIDLSIVPGNSRLIIWSIHA